MKTNLKLKSDYAVDEIRFENVSLSTSENRDPVLQNIDYSLPTDEVLVIESTHAENASLFLKMLAGQLETSTGHILWNGEKVFLGDSQIDPREWMGCYFESYRPGAIDSFLSVWGLLDQKTVFLDLVEHFELEDVSDTPLKKLSYSYQKLAYLVGSALKNSQVLILEDPASGLEESQWLNFLDFVQLRQRQGFLRHVFMTNHHPTALRHISHNKIILEDGLLYFDEALSHKKASHF